MKKKIKKEITNEEIMKQLKTLETLIYTSYNMLIILSRRGACDEVYETAIEELDKLIERQRKDKRS